MTSKTKTPPAAAKANPDEDSSAASPAAPVVGEAPELHLSPSTARRPDQPAPEMNVPAGRAEREMAGTRPGLDPVPYGRPKTDDD